MQDSERIHVEFHNKANEMMLSRFSDFRTAARKINRKEDEYRFKALQDQHVNSLKQQLEMTAREILNRNQHGNRMGEVDRSLQNCVRDYLHQVLQKAKEL